MAKAKKQTRSNKLLNLFYPKTPAQGMLLFAIVFAIVGSGYAVYHSFALSTLDTAPLIAVSNPICNDTRFQIASYDIDSSTRTASYAVKWQLQSLLNGTWTTTQSGTTPNEFGSVSTIHNVNFTTTPSLTRSHRVIITTSGYGIPHVRTATSAIWTACTT